MSAGRWIETCECGRETRVRDLAYVVTGGTRACDAPHPSISEQEPRPTVPTELGWCGCGSPDDVDAMMLAYLASRDAEWFPKPAPIGVGSDAVDLLAYMADALEWTEHGTSIGGAWLTDRGRNVLRILRSSLSESSK